MANKFRMEPPIRDCSVVGVFRPDHLDEVEDLTYDEARDTQFNSDNGAEIDKSFDLAYFLEISR